MLQICIFLSLFNIITTHIFHRFAKSTKSKPQLESMQGTPDSPTSALIRKITPTSDNTFVIDPHDAQIIAKMISNIILFPYRMKYR